MFLKNPNNWKKEECNLIITREHVAYEPEAAADRTLRALKDGVVKSIDGYDVPIRFETVCIHSDTPGIEAVAPALNNALAPYMLSTTAWALRLVLIVANIVEALKSCIVTPGADS